MNKNKEGNMIGKNDEFPESILVTGGTGSFGRRFVKTILEKWPQCKRVVVYSRDELKQWEMLESFPKEYISRVRMFLGDIRDKDRLKKALEGIQCVIHAAALKQVPAAEYNPSEFIKTNVYGTENIVEASIEVGVKNLISLSTDKAAAPVNLYGATKLCADKLVIAANNVKGSRDIKFIVIRYGNVIGSRGSVIPLFLKQKKSGNLTITHKEMTRFSITLDQGVDIVLQALFEDDGGKIIVPKLPSYRILDVAKAIAPEANFVETGIRPGEKLHEELITSSDSFNAYKGDKNYVIYPPGASPDLDKYTKMEQGLSYNSKDNDWFLTQEEIRTMADLYLSEQDKF